MEIEGLRVEVGTTEAPKIRMYHNVKAEITATGLLLLRRLDGNEFKAAFAAGYWTFVSAVNTKDEES